MPVVDEKELLNILQKNRKGKKVVTVNGCFDLLHAAHVRLLKKAKSEGDYLVVLLNSDSSVRKYKGEKRPIVPQNERAELLSALSCVDFVVVFNEDDPLSLLELIKPEVHVKGGSFVPERVSDEKLLVEKHGGQLKFFGLEKGFSTTNIIEKVLEKHN